jgi:hypothetical protein
LPRCSCGGSPRASCCGACMRPTGGPDAAPVVGPAVLPLLMGACFGSNGHAGRCQPAGVSHRLSVGAGDLGLDRTGVPVGRHRRPQPRPCPPGLDRLAALPRAFGTIAVARTGCWSGILRRWSGPRPGGRNAFALLDLALLFGARISAKLNLFFGVPRINTDFLPARWRICQLFPQGPGQRVLSAVGHACWPCHLGCFLERLWRARDAGRVIGFHAADRADALALLEHWFMVWRVPTTNSGAG